MNRKVQSISRTDNCYKLNFGKSIGVRAFSDLGGRWPSCPKKIFNLMLTILVCNETSKVIPEILILKTSSIN